jgi:hypothetical protein
MSITYYSPQLLTSKVNCDIPIRSDRCYSRPVQQLEHLSRHHQVLRTLGEPNDAAQCGTQCTLV